MSYLYANIATDESVINRLTEYVERNEVSISFRSDGGLDVDVSSKSFFKNPDDYARVKNFLRQNGFSSWIGIASRRRVDKPIKRENFYEERLFSEKHFNEVLEKLDKNINNINF